MEVKTQIDKNHKDKTTEEYKNGIEACVLSTRALFSYCESTLNYMHASNYED